MGASRLRESSVEISTRLLSHQIWDRREDGAPDETIRQSLCVDGYDEASINRAFNHLLEISNLLIHDSSLRSTIIAKFNEALSRCDYDRVRIAMLDGLEDERTLYKIFLTLSATLKQGESDRAVVAAFALSFIDGIGHVPLIEALSNDEPEIRLAAVTRLGEMESAAVSAIPALRRVVADTDSELAQAAVFAIEKIEGLENESR